MSLAADALGPARPENVRCIESAQGGQELAVQVRGYLASPPASEQPAKKYWIASRSRPTFIQVLRGQDNLVFANARAEVELLAARLRDLCEAAGVPNEFLPHHGNLSRELREDVEAALKDHGRPATAVATTTLEMGIDIGSVHSVAQVGRAAIRGGPPPAPRPFGPPRRTRHPAYLRHRAIGRPADITC